MSKQALDLQRSAKIVRRRWVLVVVVAVLGVIGGGGFSVLRPLMVTSEALVVLPKAAPSIETEILVAASDPVLMGALPNVSPHMSLQKLQTLVHVQSVTPVRPLDNRHGRDRGSGRDDGQRRRPQLRRIRQLGEKPGRPPGGGYTAARLHRDRVVVSRTDDHRRPGGRGRGSADRGHRGPADQPYRPAAHETR